MEISGNTLVSQSIHLLQGSPSINDGKMSITWELIRVNTVVLNFIVLIYFHYYLFFILVHFHYFHFHYHHLFLFIISCYQHCIDLIAVDLLHV